MANDDPLTAPPASGGSPAATVLRARAAVRTAPQDPAAHRALAHALKSAGAERDARGAWAQAIRLSRNVPAIAQAHAAVLGGRAREAVDRLASHLDAHPGDPVALLVHGEALVRLGRMDDAIASLEAALALTPEYREPRMALVRAHHQRFDPRAGLAALAPLLASGQTDVVAMRWQAMLLTDAGAYAPAEQAYRTLRELAPRDPAVLVAHGDALRTLGRTDEAEAAYRAALASAPASMTAPWWSLASLGGNRVTQGDRRAIEAALAAPHQPGARTYLLFAAATAADKAGEHENAFALFAEGNRLRRAAMRYDSAAFASRMAAIRELDSDFFASRAGWGEQSAAPIFIIGMPRAGSTLTEQILAGHSAITAGGEMPIVASLLRDISARLGLDPDRQVVELLQSLDAGQCAALGAEYLRRARDRCGDGARFTDKLPHNWAEIAFMRLILPRAAIVDIRRGALDCCVSNFVLLFEPGHPASYDLIEMADYYTAYAHTMEWANRALPGAVHLLRYETLVDDPERETRALLSWLGLDFEPGCLALGGERVIATASAEQARQPINRSGLDTWKRFAPWIEPLRARLGPLAES